MYFDDRCPYPGSGFLFYNGNDRAKGMLWQKRMIRSKSKALW